MDVKIRSDRKIEISMKKQISEALKWFNENITEKPVTPANKNQFTINNESTDLDENGKDIFHSM